MKNSDKNKIDLAKVLRKTGFHLPSDESEVESFEKSLEENNSKPADWDNPIAILQRGKVKSININSPELDMKATNNLSMAAREGKEITGSVRIKMNEDRKNTKK